MEKGDWKEQASSGKQSSRWPALTRMLASGEMSDEPLREYTTKEKIEIWMINEGYQRIFIAVFVLLHAMVFAFGFMNYQLKDNLTDARRAFGVTYAIARASSLVLHVDVALVLFPVCRTLVSLARQTPLNSVIQLDKNIAFHKLVAWSIFFFSWLHTFAHWNNYARLAAQQKLGFSGFLLANLSTGPGWSGYIMLTALTAMVLTSAEKPRRANHERFWYTHHLFTVFFALWSVHGAFCMIKADAAPFCAGTGVFYQYWLAGGLAYLAERVARELRGRHRTFVTKVIQHPSGVCEIQMKKEHTRSRAGQYVFLCCPAVSVWQYHPFTLTSAPEEDYLSVHVRCVGNFTRDLARALGCDFEKHDDDGEGDGGDDKSGVGGGKGRLKDRTRSVVVSEMAAPAATDAEQGGAVDRTLRRVLPRVYIDGPFGSASEDVFKFEVAVLVGAGIGVTPFASILKSIWYRINYPQGRTRLRKVYFFWICRDVGSFEWFRSLLLAIEAQDLDDRIEIHTILGHKKFQKKLTHSRRQYLTARIKADDATNIMINNANAEQDAITGLRAPTNFGRPNWDMIFKSIRKIHSPSEAGVFYCGPKALGSVLHIKCNMYSDPEFAFNWGKENF